MSESDINHIVASSISYSRRGGVKGLKAPVKPVDDFFFKVQQCIVMLPCVLCVNKVSFHEQVRLAWNIFFPPPEKPDTSKVSSMAVVAASPHCI
jgi:hypothetical protein